MPRSCGILLGTNLPGICGRGVWRRGDTAVADMAIALPWTFACLVFFVWLGPIRCPKPQIFTHLKRHVPKRHVYRLPNLAAPRPPPCPLLRCAGAIRRALNTCFFFLSILQYNMIYNNMRSSNISSILSILILLLIMMMMM
jgi:hypothetical protein